MQKIKFIDPPNPPDLPARQGRKPGNVEFDAIAGQLMSKRRRWGLVYVESSSTDAVSRNAALNQALRSRLHEYVVTQRKFGENSYGVWAIAL